MISLISAQGSTHILSWDTKGVDGCALVEQHDVIVSCADRIEQYPTVI